MNTTIFDIGDNSGTLSTLANRGNGIDGDEFFGIIKFEDEVSDAGLVELQGIIAARAARNIASFQFVKRVEVARLNQHEAVIRTIIGMDV